MTAVLEDAWFLFLKSPLTHSMSFAIDCYLPQLV